MGELSYRNFRDWCAVVRGFSHAAAMGSSNWSAVLEGKDGPVRLPYAGVTASFFDTLGARPLLGRDFRPEDDVPNAPRVVVLNHGTWVRRFGADPGVIGRAIRFDDTSHTIVGVMPKGFDFPRGAELWTPVVPIINAASERWGTDALTNVGVLFAIGRLREGVTPFLDFLLGPVRPALWTLFAAVNVLLLIACANVSGRGCSRYSRSRPSASRSLAW